MAHRSTFFSFPLRDGEAGLALGIKLYIQSYLLLEGEVRAAPTCFLKSYSLSRRGLRISSVPPMTVLLTVEERRQRKLEAMSSRLPPARPFVLGLGDSVSAWSILPG